jgi:hypothetical protein
MRMMLLLLLLAPAVLTTGCATYVTPVDQPKECPIHHVATRRGSVPIVYGYPVPDPPAYRDAHVKLFPHDNDRLLGGCVVRGKRTATVRYCPECRRAKEQWLAHAAPEDRPRAGTAASIE